MTDTEHAATSGSNEEEAGLLTAICVIHAKVQLVCFLSSVTSLHWADVRFLPLPVCFTCLTAS